MSFKNLIRWLVLTVLIAAPAWMLMNWWQGLSPEQKLDEMNRVQRRLPASFKFGPADPTSAAVRSRSRDASALKLPPVLPAPGDPGRSSIVSPGTARGGESEASPSTPAPAATGVIPAAAAMPIAPAAQPAPAGLEFHPETDRDPLLTQEEMARLHHVEEPVRAAKQRHRAPRSIESRIRLVGTVQTAGSLRVIVNNQILKKGDVVLGAKIVRIASTATTVAVTFQYREKGKIKRFVKRIKQ